MHSPWHKQKWNAFSSAIRIYEFVGGGARHPAICSRSMHNFESANRRKRREFTPWERGREKHSAKEDIYMCEQSVCAPGINAAVAELWWYYCESQMIEILRLPAVLLLAKWLWRWLRTEFADLQNGVCMRAWRFILGHYFPAPIRLQKSTAIIEKYL